uniref:Uncharacterized protein n=1 Tax=Zea mays TaxID=4577 RepID=A0A804N8W0_MAIZE
MLTPPARDSYAATLGPSVMRRGRWMAPPGFLGYLSASAGLCGPWLLMPPSRSCDTPPMFSARTGARRGMRPTSPSSPPPSPSFWTTSVNIPYSFTVDAADDDDDSDNDDGGDDDDEHME